MSEEVKGDPESGRPAPPANPFARRVAELRSLMLSLLASDLLEVVAKLAEMAKGGHLGALRLFLQYTVGMPQKAPDPDGIEADELRRLREDRPDPRVLKELLTRMTCLEINGFASELDPARKQYLAREFDEATKPEAPQPKPEPAAPAVENPPFPLPPAPPLPVPQQVLNESLEDIVRRSKADSKRAARVAKKRQAKKAKKRKSATR